MKNRLIKWLCADLQGAITQLDLNHEKLDRRVEECEGLLQDLATELNNLRNFSQERLGPTEPKPEQWRSGRPLRTAFVAERRRAVKTSP